MKRAIRSEAELAADLIAWLRARGWEIYEEVDCGVGRADIVAVRGPLVHVIECKVAFGFAVLEQAYRWLGHANLVSVAAAAAWGGVADLACERLGVGRYAVTLAGVTERVSPALARRTSTVIRKTLRAEHQSYARAGTNSGYFSAHRGTCARLRELVEAKYAAGRPWYYGVPVKEAIAQITHHYATDKSARQHLFDDVLGGRVPGVAAVQRSGERGWRLITADSEPGEKGTT